MMKHSVLICSFLLAAPLFAQTHVALSARTGVTADKVTVALNPSNQTRIDVCAAVIQSTTAGSVTVEVGGSAATTTEVTPAAVSPGGKTAKAKAYSNSNVGSGVTTSAPMAFQAGIPFSISLKGVTLSGPGTTKNLTLVLALASGNVTTAIYWAEDGKCEN